MSDVVKIGANAAEAMEPTACGFCMKGFDEVRKLVAGPLVAICNECISLAAEAIRERKPDRPGMTRDEIIEALQACDGSMAAGGQTDFTVLVTSDCGICMWSTRVPADVPKDVFYFARVLDH